MKYIEYSKDEINLLIKLRKDGYIGQRLYNEFRKTFPDRIVDMSIRNKIQNLREQKRILR